MYPINYDVIKTKRLSLGITGDKMAKHLGLKYANSYYRKEAGKRRFYDNELLTIMIILNLSPVDLYKDKVLNLS